MYCALIGDIINSRDIRDRNSAQDKVNNVLNQINDKYRNDIASKFTITIGDEFQGLLKNPKNLIQIIDYLKKELDPIKFRFGIGLGTMYTNINTEKAIGADGPAYYKARDAIEDLKSMNKMYEKPKQDIKINFEDVESPTISDLINAIFSTCYYIEHKWSDKQREAVYSNLFNEKSQREMAQEFNLTQSSIQRRLESAGYATYKNARLIISESLQKIWERLNND